MASAIRGDIENSIPAQRIFNWNTGNGAGGAPEVMGVKRQTSDLIARYKDSYNLSWEQLKKVFDTIISTIENEGTLPNTKIIKIAEMMVDDALTNGYSDFDGMVKIQPATDYIFQKAMVQGTQFNGYGYLDGTEKMPAGLAYDAAMGYGQDASLSLNMSSDDVKAIQEIPWTKSINDLTPDELQKVQKIAKQDWNTLGAKSPFFRSWFGDWRSNDKSDIAVVTERDSARSPVTNEDTGWEIRIAGKVFSETKANKSKKFQAAIPYLDFVRSIAKNAILLDTHGVGGKKYDGTLLMHDLYAVVDDGTEPAVIKIQVKESNDPLIADTVKIAYDLSTMEIINDAGVNGLSENAILHITNASNIRSIADLYAYVKSKGEISQGNRLRKIGIT